MISSSPNIGLCSRVCLELMSGLRSGFKLFTDNYYTSPQLYLALYNKGYNCCGTVRKGRKEFPEDLVITKGTKVSRKYMDYRSNGPLLAFPSLTDAVCTLSIQCTMLNVMSQQPSRGRIQMGHTYGVSLHIKFIPVSSHITSVGSRAGSGRNSFDDCCKL